MTKLSPARARARARSAWRSASSGCSPSAKRRSRPTKQVDRSQIELVVSAQTEGGEHDQTLAEMVEAQLLTCRLEVKSDLAGPIEPLGDGRFRAVLFRRWTRPTAGSSAAASRTW